jgi:hypothetical protein
MNIRLIDHPLSPLIVAWLLAVQNCAMYGTPKNYMDEQIARDLLNAALKESI